MTTHVWSDDDSDDEAYWNERLNPKSPAAAASSSSAAGHHHHRGRYKWYADGTTRNGTFATNAHGGEPRWGRGGGGDWSNAVGGGGGGDSSGGGGGGERAAYTVSSPSPVPKLNLDGDLRQLRRAAGEVVNIHNGDDDNDRKSDKPAAPSPLGRRLTPTTTAATTGAESTMTTTNTRTAAAATTTTTTTAAKMTHPHCRSTAGSGGGSGGSVHDDVEAELAGHFVSYDPRPPRNTAGRGVGGKTRPYLYRYGGGKL